MAFVGSARAVECNARRTSKVGGNRKTAGAMQLHVLMMQYWTIKCMTRAAFQRRLGEMVEGMGRCNITKESKTSWIKKDASRGKEKRKIESLVTCID